MPTIPEICPSSDFDPRQCHPPSLRYPTLRGYYRIVLGAVRPAGTSVLARTCGPGKEKQDRHRRSVLFVEAQVSPRRSELPLHEACHRMTDRHRRDMNQNLLYPNATQSGPKVRKSLRLVLGLGETPYAKAAEAHFAALGWDLTVAKTAKEARKLAVKQRAAAAVLAADLGPESGWLASVKLTRARPGTRVVLVGKVR